MNTLLIFFRDIWQLSEKVGLSVLKGGGASSSSLPASGDQLDTAIKASIAGASIVGYMYRAYHVSCRSNVNLNETYINTSLTSAVTYILSHS